MGKKARLKKEFKQNTTPEKRKELKLTRRERINEKESQVEWIEKKGGNPELKYHRGYIACWKDKRRYIGHAPWIDKDGTERLKEVPYKPLLRGTFTITDRV